MVWLILIASACASAMLTVLSLKLRLPIGVAGFRIANSGRRSYVYRAPTELLPFRAWHFHHHATGWGADNRVSRLMDLVL